MKKGKKTALVTGVGREQGLGFGICKALIENDFHVVVTARTKEKAVAMAEKIDASGEFVSAAGLDTGSDESAEALQQFLLSEFDCLDVLINNAGGALDYMIPPSTTSFEDVQKAFEVNLFGTWRVIRHLLPAIRKSQHPRIVNISSGAGSFSHPVFGLSHHPALVTAYGLSKLALNGLTVQFARELSPEGILINAVNPGFVATADGMEAMGARSVSDSVDGILWAATLPDNGPSGCFFEDRKPLGW